MLIGLPLLLRLFGCGAPSIEPTGPVLPLTSKQLKEKKYEAERIAAQLAKIFNTFAMARRELQPILVWVVSV